uniref:Uncharacterized protein n=1 Tax=Rhodopseudomonas palustris (strain BisA53) TaxID=316055 RepID=Q07NX3_RHOP5
MTSSAMPAFGLDLALANFAPVLFTALALICIARLVRALANTHAPMALLGAALVVLAGLCKAVWKLILALGGPDLPWLSQALFPLMAPGFALLAVALWQAQRKTPASRQTSWLMALALIGLGYGVAGLRSFGLAQERGWFLPLMILASAANLTLTLLLLREAWRRRALWLAPLFVANLAMVFALQRLARLEPKTLSLHWLEQSLTALGAGAFALGAWLLLRRLGSAQHA